MLRPTDSGCATERMGGEFGDLTIRRAAQRCLNRRSASNVQENKGTAEGSKKGKEGGKEGEKRRQKGRYVECPTKVSVFNLDNRTGPHATRTQHGRLIHR